MPRGSPADSAAAMGAAFAGAGSPTDDEAEEARAGAGGMRGTGTLELINPAEPSQQAAAAVRAKIEPVSGEVALS